MEEERVTWEIEELNYNFLDNYFEKTAKGRKLSFTDFMAFENVQAEIWYHDGKGRSLICFLMCVPSSNRLFFPYDVVCSHRLLSYRFDGKLGGPDLGNHGWMRLSKRRQSHLPVHLQQGVQQRLQTLINYKRGVIVNDDYNDPSWGKAESIKKIITTIGKKKKGKLYLINNICVLYAFM